MEIRNGRPGMIFEEPSKCPGKMALVPGREDA